MPDQAGWRHPGGGNLASGVSPTPEVFAVERVDHAERSRASVGVSRPVHKGRVEWTVGARGRPLDSIAPTNSITISASIRLSDAVAARYDIRRSLTSSC